MSKFDSDFAIFGTLATDMLNGGNIGAALFTYANSACIDLYGDLRGKTTLEVISEIAQNREEGIGLVRHLAKEGTLSFEGVLSGKFVKYHTRIVRHGESGAEPSEQFIQAGITDITESVTLKSLLYGSSEALKRAARAADEDTGRHVVRINQYAKHLASLFDCSESFVEDISQFAQLHDIGKIKVSEIIRLPRKLTDEEFEKIKKHTLYGGKMVEGLAGLDMAYNIALEHHERWDGSGYPYGKCQKEIALEARIVNIADVFDALVSERPYKPAFTYETAFQIISEGDGRVMPTHFDPELLPMFLMHYDEFADLHRELKG